MGYESYYMHEDLFGIQLQLQLPVKRWWLHRVPPPTFSYHSAVLSTLPAQAHVLNSHINVKKSTEYFGCDTK